MKNISITSLILVSVLFGAGFPSRVFALAEYQSFNASLSLNGDCDPILTYSVTITPSSITTGNNFIISVSPLNSQGQPITDSSNTGTTNPITGNNQEYTVSVPANGVVNNQTMALAQSINVLTNYQVRMHEYSAQSQYMGSSSLVTVTPTQGSCVNPNQQAEAPTDSAPSLEYMEIEIENPISVNSIPDLVQTILEGLIKIGIPLLVVMIVYSGWLYLFARGDPGKIKSAHDMFLYTLLGGAILLAAWAIAQLIHSTLLDLTASVIKFFV